MCALLIVAAPIVAAEERPSDGSVNDPWEGFNRPVFKFNDGVDRAAIKPAATAYDSMPDIVGDRFANFVGNLDDVPTMLNNLMQGDVGDAAVDLGRVLINTTVGILGLFDVASHMGLEKHHDEFSQTLAGWGVPGGPYLVVPILGPSSARDFPADIVDIFMNPATYFEPVARVAVTVIKGLETRAGLLDKEDILKEWSNDYYVAVRNYYLSRSRSAGGDESLEQPSLEDDYGTDLLDLTDEEESGSESMLMDGEEDESESESMSMGTEEEEEEDGFELKYELEFESEEESRAGGV